MANSMILRWQGIITESNEMAGHEIIGNITLEIGHNLQGLLDNAVNS